MGAKLSKKKKGYCLGAGKDGESTETTEVEQKETETQVGQIDAAEPNGENPSTDQTLNNGASEEQEAHVEKNSTEVPSGETTKDDSNKDQKSECKPSPEQKKVEESSQEQEDAKSSNLSQQTAMEGGKEVKSQPEEKQKNDHDKEKESLAKDESTQEHKSATEQESSEPKQSNTSVTEPSAPLADQKEVTKPVPDPETKEKIEEMEKEQTQVPMDEHLSQQTTEETLVADSVKEPERTNEKVEKLVVETALVAPVLQEPVPAPVVEIESEPAKVVEQETTEVSLPDTQPVTELVKPESDIAPEPVTEAVESKVSEEPTAPVPEVEHVESVSNSELVPCPAHEQLNSTKQEVESLPEPLPSNEVPDSTAHTEGNVENHETLCNDDLGTELVETPAATTESGPTEQPSAEKIHDQNSTVIENGPSEQAAEEIQENKVQDTVSTGQEVDKEMQNEVKEEVSVSDKQSTDHASLVKDSTETEEAALDISKNVHNEVTSEDTTVHDATQDNNFEDKIENHKIPAEEVSHEPSAPIIVDKHGVGNGLPLKEEVKEHLENGCDTILHELNGQGEGHEIEVCNE